MCYLSHLTLWIVYLTLVARTSFNSLIGSVNSDTTVSCEREDEVGSSLPLLWLYNGALRNLTLVI